VILGTLSKLGGSEILRERLDGVGPKRSFEKPLKLPGIMDGLDGFADPFWISAMPDFQGAQQCGPECTQFPLGQPLQFALKFASLPKLIGECHGFGLKGFGADFFDALLEEGDVHFRIQNVPQEPLQPNF
jgi:hypothetical protein